MKRLMWFVAGALVLPLSAAAQGAPPSPSTPAVPPAAPRAVAPAVPAVPPAPALPAEVPVPHPHPEPFELPVPVPHFELMELKDHLQQLQHDLRFDVDEHLIAQQARLSADHAMNEARVQLENLKNFRFDFDPWALQQGKGPVVVAGFARPGDEAGLYNNGLNALQQRQYERAITMFDRFIAQKGSRTDGALYWKAFAQARLARPEEALATLADLRRDYPQSRYVNDAKVLDADVRKLSGQRLDPQTLDANDEMKLLAINGIANTDPARAIPLLEGVLNANNTLANKKRALYVLALSNDPKAHQILLKYAKGAGNPELQLEAIRYLASRRDQQTTDGELKEIYESTQDANIRRTIIDSYRNAGDKGKLIAIAKDKAETAELRRTAIGGLSNLAAPPELWALYQQESDPQLRIQMISVFGAMGAIDQLTQVAKTEKDANVRGRAFRTIGGLRNEKAGQLLVDLYAGEQDKEVRKSIISALQGQNNAAGLVAIARKETDLDLKRDIFRRLSDMAPKDKIAADYLMEMLK
jgi:HEAT repeats/Tetratricopeptide repeat